MRFFNYKIAITIISLTFASSLVYKFGRKKKKTGRLINREIHEVLMFSNDTVNFTPSKYSRCVITQSMDRLLFHLGASLFTLDVCMYMCTNTDLTNTLLKLHYRGVKMRVILDADMAFSTGSCLRRLEKHGIPVRWMKSTNLMHHKFCLIDASAGDICTPIVIMGSLNWTNQGLWGNWEDVVVTTQPALVEQYAAEFEKLWLAFRPVVDLI